MVDDGSKASPFLGSVSMWILGTRERGMPRTTAISATVEKVNMTTIEATVPDYLAR
jgi:hypothetical protein